MQSFAAILKLTKAQIWDLFEHRHLFRARNPARELHDGYHLAEMQAVLGSPPLKLLGQSERSHQFWDEKGLCGYPSTINSIIFGNVNCYIR